MFSIIIAIVLIGLGIVIPVVGQFLIAGLLAWAIMAISKWLISGE